MRFVFHKLDDRWHWKLRDSNGGTAAMNAIGYARLANMVQVLRRIFRTSDRLTLAVDREYARTLRKEQT